MNKHFRVNGRLGVQLGELGVSVSAVLRRAGLRRELFDQTRASSSQRRNCLHCGRRCKTSVAIPASAYASVVPPAHWRELHESNESNGDGLVMKHVADHRVFHRPRTRARLASLILKRGWYAVVTARNVAAVEDIAAPYPETVLALLLDVTKPEQIAAVIR
jgi:hypothetical protein